VLGVSSVLVVGLALSLGASGRSDSTLQPASPSVQIDDREDTAEAQTPIGPVLSAAPAAKGGVVEPPAGERETGAGGDVAGSTGASNRRVRPSAPVTRAKVRDLPHSCGQVAPIPWCLQVRVSPAPGGHTLISRMCVNANAGVGDLDFETTQEADFELLSGSRVIWRWSDTQTFTQQPHQISAITGECYTWQTRWDQFDGRGERVGKARLTLRVRHLASQRSYPAEAAVAFFTTA